MDSPRWKFWLMFVVRLTIFVGTLQLIHNERWQELAILAFVAAWMGVPSVKRWVEGLAS